MTGETFVSVDVETAGPSPGSFALLSIGACLADDPATGFYVELKPTSERADPAALAVSGLELGRLAREGLEPAVALTELAAWLAAHCPGGRPVFVGLNASFDWMFVAEYFHHYLGHNPFGHAALDIKALFMGLSGVAWRDTGRMAMLEWLGLEPTPLTHNALADARDQARLFRAVLERVREKGGLRG